MEIQVNRRRAVRIFGMLLERYRKKAFPYERVKEELPQARIPAEIKRDPLVHAQFLFFATDLMSGRIRSDTAMRELVAYFEEEPRMFDPSYVRSVHPDDVFAFLNRRIKVVATKKTAEHWVANADHLVRHWHGDPRKLFEGTTSPDEIRRRCCNKRNKRRERDERFLGFMGRQEKLTSMQAYFLLDGKLIAPIHIAPPPDFRIQRLLTQTEIVIPPRTYASPGPLADAIVSLTEWYLERYDGDMVALSDALWHFPGALCRGAPGTVHIWTEKKIAQYLKSCGCCPLFLMHFVVTVPVSLVAFWLGYREPSRLTFVYLAALGLIAFLLIPVIPGSVQGSDAIIYLLLPLFVPFLVLVPYLFGALTHYLMRGRLAPK